MSRGRDVNDGPCDLLLRSNSISVGGEAFEVTQQGAMLLRMMCLLIYVTYTVKGSVCKN